MNRTDNTFKSKNLITQMQKDIKILD